MSDTYTLDAGDGQITIARQRARVLAARLSGVKENLFYEDANGTGGDRLWISPENAYFWPDTELAGKAFKSDRENLFNTYKIPEAVDPGKYEVADFSDRHVTLINADIHLTDRRVDKKIHVDAQRQVRVVDKPKGLPSGLSVASFAITNTLTLKGGDEGAVAGAWDLVQVPWGGVIICPTVHAIKQSPASYYDPFGDSVTWTDDQIRFAVNGKAQTKMALPPEVTTGRMGYLKGNTLIVRIFAPMIGEPYVDMPVTADKSLRFGCDCLQTYGDNGFFGPFGEMEYHDPALVVGRSPSVRSNTCVTHVLAGDEAAIHEAGAILLGVDIR